MSRVVETTEFYRKGKIERWTLHENGDVRLNGELTPYIRIPIVVLPINHPIWSFNQDTADDGIEVDVILRERKISEEENVNI